MKLLSTILAIGALNLSAAHAASFYVEKNGSGDHCSMDMPCASIQTAINKASAGDNIKIERGHYYENVTIPIDKAGLSITGAGKKATKIVAPDLAPVKFAPPTVPAEIVLDIFAPSVTVRDLAIVHPSNTVDKRDIGIFVRPPANNVTLTDLIIKRMRTGDNLEPFTPGSRGLLVFRATGTEISDSKFSGNYEDHIHLPTSKTLVKDNDVEGAIRIGIVVIQENADTKSEENVIVDNEVEESGSDGIQIQGDNNIVKDNEVEENGGFGIQLCGPGSSPACVAPGHVASADNNMLKDNETEENALGNIIDNGVANSIYD